ncbi:MAG: peptidoglycan-binding protein, partial [Propionibacteriaceae bacterium]|nr:peptidoglycan-binding protein [Propionibacteriaceae bacterium]
MAATYIPGQSLATMPDASYQRMLAAGMPTGGIDVYRRTMAQQQALYDAYKAGKGPVAAKPSPTAPHIRGYAIDTHTTTAGTYDPSSAHRWLTTGGDGASKPKAGEKLRAHDYGWRRTVPSERWHFGYDLALDKVLWKLVQKAIGGLVVDGIPGPKTTAALKAWQKAHGLTADGVPGPATLSKLDSKPTPAPTPSPAPAPAGVNFRVASYNAQLQRFNGGPYAADATFVKDVLAASILLGQEMENACSEAITKKTKHKAWAYKTIRLHWQPKKYD